MYLSNNPVQHQRTKHIEIDLHFVRERVGLGDVRVLHVPTTQQFAYIFTKGLSASTFGEFRSSLSVGDATRAGGGGSVSDFPHQTARANSVSAGHTPGCGITGHAHPPGSHRDIHGNNHQHNQLFSFDRATTIRVYLSFRFACTV